MKKSTAALTFIVIVICGVVFVGGGAVCRMSRQQHEAPEAAEPEYIPALVIAPPPEKETEPIDEQDYDIDDDEYGYEPEYIEEEDCNLVTVTISAAGDVTLGGDRRWAGYHAFMREFERSGRDHSHFLSNVRHIFEEDDLTIVNLEGTLTYATEHMDKTFVFRGSPHFAQILSSSGVDVVSLANNHTIDFFDRGYRDTIASLEAEDVAYFGNEFNTILEVNGIYVGLFGYSIWNDSQHNRNLISASIADLRDRGAQLIIAYFHWGREGQNSIVPHQRTIGRFTIYSGADLVLGAHPHVLQGIEEYRGRYIVYSLANFSFGGNANPSDQDTMIFQQTFTFDDGVLQDTNDINIISAFISSVREYNNFQPTPATGEDAERILQRVRTYSDWLLE